jgi:hypothetical protein
MLNRRGECSGLRATIPAAKNQNMTIIRLLPYEFVPPVS